MDYIENETVTEDSLLDDAIALCKGIRRKKRKLSDLEITKKELRERFPEDGHTEFETEIIRLYEELSSVVDRTMMLKIEGAEAKHDLEQINSELHRYEYSDHPPFDDSYFMRRILKLKYTIKCEVIEKKLDTIKENARPYREQIQGNLITLIGEITEIFPSFSKNEMFMVTPKLYITPRRKVYELSSQNHKVNGAGIVDGIIAAAFKQVDGMTYYVEESLKQDYISFYEITSKITNTYENGYEIAADLLRFTTGEGSKKDISVKVKKLGSKKYGELYE